MSTYAGTFTVTNNTGQDITNLVLADWTTNLRSRDRWTWMIVDLA